MRARVMRRPAKAACGLGLGLWAATSVGCFSDANAGFDPPTDGFTFPAGMVLDPRAATDVGDVCEADDECDSGELCAAGVCRPSARWMFVTNANSDLSFNAGTITAVDLDAFHEALEGSVGEIGASVSESRPCRRVALTPQVVECEESYFVDEDATVFTGSFSGVVEGWVPPDATDEAVLLTPVRSGPSITWARVSGGLGDGGLDIECGQGANSGRPHPRECSNGHRMRRFRNDPDSARLANEPFGLAISDDPAIPLAYVTHQVRDDITLIRMDGLRVDGDPGDPIIIDQADMLSITGSISGGAGIVQRPCDPVSPPDATVGCSIPMVYAAMRFSGAVAAVVAVGIDDEDLVPPSPHTPGQHCVGPEDIGEPGGVVCEERVFLNDFFVAEGIDSSGLGFTAERLGMMEFSEEGDELYLVQTNPGALVRLDTSLDANGIPRNLSADQEEVCSNPTAFALYEDAQARYGLVSCYRSGEVFVVDLETLDTVKVIRAGTGPHQITVDLAREYVYVANTLDATISLVDMSRDRETRFSEVARLGRQEPYTE